MVLRLIAFGRLRSLLDMQKVNGAAFYRAATSLKSVEALLGQTLQEKSKAKRAFLAEKTDDKYKTNMLKLIGALNA
jgi:hypothetical protein